MGIKTSGGYTNTGAYITPKMSPGRMERMNVSSSRPIKSSVRLGKGSSDNFHSSGGRSKVIKTTSGYNK